MTTSATTTNSSMLSSSPLSSSASSTSSIRDENTSTSCTDHNTFINKSIIVNTNSKKKIVSGEDHVKFGELPIIEKKEKKIPRRRRTPYAWDDQLRPIFDDDKTYKKTEDKK